MSIPAMSGVCSIGEYTFMNRYEIVATIEAESLLEIGRELNLDNLKVRTLSIARLDEDEDEECTD